MPDVRTLIADLSQRAGLDPDTDIDVSAVYGKLDGMIVTSFGTARASLEPLLVTFMLDVAEGDGKVRFTPRGGDPVATIGEDDLVPMDTATGSATLLVTRSQEADLPKRVEVAYVARSADWGSGTQSARRMVGNTVNAMTVNLPLAIGDQQARRLADALLYDAWVQREAVTFQTTARFAWVQPGDVVTVTAAGTTRTLRVLKTDASGLLVRMEAVPDDPEVLASESEGADIGRGNVFRVIPATVLFLLDLPALRDDDDDSGIYVAASFLGTDTGYRWRGAVLYLSSDDGASFQALADLRGPATWGTCQTVLGDGPAHVWDEANSLTVVLNHGQLESRGRAAVLNGANAALVGREIIQFRDAVLTAPDTYVLSGLLRGRRGTEHAIAGHGAGEAFLLLTSYDLVRVPLALSVLGRERQFKGITVGLAQDSQAGIPFTFRGTSMKPYAPCHVRGRRSGDDWVLSWVRRTRIGGGWSDGTDVPLAEEREQYDVEILDGGSIRRSFFGLTAPSATYSAAQQVADFGAPQTALAVRVFQVSARVGRGLPAGASL